MTGSPPARRVVKPSRVLDEAQAEAEIPYEETRLARQAPKARRRLFGVLLVGALALGIESWARDPLWVVPAVGLVGAAWGVRAQRLGGIVAAAFAGLVATLLGLGVLAFARPGGSDLVAALVALVLGAASLPDVLTLVRDAELQHAYGRWARRQA